MGNREEMIRFAGYDAYFNDLIPIKKILHIHTSQNMFLNVILIHTGILRRFRFERQRHFLCYNKDHDVRCFR